MSKQQTTRRQKDISRLLREQKQIQKDRIRQSKKKRKAHEHHGGQ
ncbi:MAG: hypothetical protein ABSB79_13300 [Syntrophales bacterium]